MKWGNKIEKKILPLIPLVVSKDRPTFKGQSMVENRVMISTVTTMEVWTLYIRLQIQLGLKIIAWQALLGYFFFQFLVTRGACCPLLRMFSLSAWLTGWESMI